MPFEPVPDPLPALPAVAVCMSVSAPLVEPLTALVSEESAPLPPDALVPALPPLPPVWLAVTLTAPPLVEEPVTVPSEALPPLPPAARPPLPAPPVAEAVTVTLAEVLLAALAVEVALPPLPPAPGEPFMVPLPPIPLKPPLPPVAVALAEAAPATTTVPTAVAEAAPPFPLIHRCRQSFPWWHFLQCRQRFQFHRRLWRCLSDQSWSNWPWRCRRFRPCRPADHCRRLFRRWCRPFQWFPFRYRSQPMPAGHRAPLRN